MSSDVLILIIGVALAVIVVILGLRRNLSEVTQSWLPRFEKGPESVDAAPELYAGGQTRQLSPRQRKFAIGFNLLAGLSYVVLVVLSANYRWMHVSLAVLFVIGAALEMRKLRKARATAE